MHLVIDVLTHPSTIVGMFGIAASMLAVVFGQWRWHHSPIYQHIVARARQ